MPPTQKPSLKRHVARTFSLSRSKVHEHQARAVTFRTHQCFVKQRTQLINALRGHLAEFGVIAPGGATNVKQLEQAIREEGTDLPAAVREMARFYLEQIAALTIRIDGLVQQLQLASRTDGFLRRLCTVPGVGPVTAGAIAAFAPDLRTFSNGRNFSAWLGLVCRRQGRFGKFRARLGTGVGVLWDYRERRVAGSDRNRVVPCQQSAWQR